jgi:hypothetical protein
MLRHTVVIVLFLCMSLSTGLYSQGVVINEIMPLNGTTLTDMDGDFSDWIELYNAGGLAADLSGYGLTDDMTMPFKWVFPSVTMLPHDFLLVFASGKDRKDISLNWETIVDWGDTWRYLVPSAEPPAGWRTTGFDDSSWNSGKSGFGYGDNDDSTFLSQILSVYIRKTIIIDDISVCRKALLHIDYDDGFVAYLNGHEIARGNIGTPGIPPVFNQGATSSSHEAVMYAGGKPEEFEIDSVFNYLNQGENILAIQVHNYNTGSSDLTAIPFFTLGLTVPPQNPEGLSPYLSIKPQELHTNFKIKSSGESLFLYDNSGALMDSMHVNVPGADISKGRKPDGYQTLLFFTTATPGTSNDTEGIIFAPGKVPGFSHQAGFYPSSFSLTLTAPAGDTVYYTTDGSVPDKSSIRYHNPVLITQSTVLKTRIISGGVMGDMVTKSYIIGRNFDMPVVSVSLEPDDLWDYNNGIYVEGPNAQQAMPHYGANYWMDWEKPAHIEFFEPDGSPGFELDAGIKTYGQWSRTHPQKSLAVYARNIYGDNRIDYDIFRFIPVNSFKSVVLRNSGNDFLYSTFRDLFHQSLVADLDIDLVAYRPAVIYLNGAYWGIQNIREKITEHYVASHYTNVDKDSIDMLENNLNTVHGSSENYTAMLNFIQSSDISDISVYNQLKTMMDVSNFIDYQLTQIYINNTDWPGNNVKYWRKKSTNGKWRWIMFDTDFGFNLYNTNDYTNNTLAFAIVPNNQNQWPNPAWATYLFQRLLQNQQFRIDFINHFADNLNTRFLPERVKDQIMYFRKKYMNEMPYHIEKWSSSMSSWNNSIENMLTFATYRDDYVRNHILSQFGINSTHQINLNVNISGSGKIKINTITPFNYPWKGLYFDKIPVQLTARPEPGYRFVSWQGSVESNNRTIPVDVLSDMNITANFEEDGSGLNHIIINEINYNSASSIDAGDWIEIYNGGDDAKDISSWRISDSENSHVYLIPQNTILEPKAFLVICRDSSLFISQYPAVSNYTGNLSFGFASSGDCIRLFTNNGILVDSVCYKPIYPWPEMSDGTGHSLALNDPSLDNENPENWISSEKTGTPGYPNDVLTNVDKPVITEIPAGSGYIYNYPNPFTGYTFICMHVESPDAIRLTVHDISGRLIEILADDYFNSGVYEFRWNASQSEKLLPPGIYLVKMESSQSSSVMKITLMN